ncbi:hypothetical protein LZG04_17430 [Saccharothrix sp. S26]|uniref:hypothetical protein n=1 Tax=Saccharothrix sp. S26 TaxID=2907215 RepID=UPI001F2EB98B|nr:hypothetical protein [Saccharothrix sp. S26]MCE6996570.1 hypothetical protein [Saccharothrix sp. S26]
MTTREGIPTALLVDGTRCALIGGYGKEQDLVRVGELTGDGRFVVRRQRRLAPPPGHRWTMAGRGGILHLFSGASHCLLDLDQVS